MHTSKRMHFIEEMVEHGEADDSGCLAYVKTYALH